MPVIRVEVPTGTPADTQRTIRIAVKAAVLKTLAPKQTKKARVDAIAEILNDPMGVDAADIYVVFRENPAENHYCGGTPLPPWVPADA